MATQAGVGTSEKSKASYDAGVEAAKKALEIANGDEPLQLVLVIMTEQFEEAEVLSGVKSVTGDTPLAGCTAASVIANGKAYSEAVSVAVLRSDTLTITCGLAEDISGNTKESGRQLATILSKNKEAVSMESVVLMFVDASKTKGVISEVLSGAYEILGASFRFVGGGSSDNLHFKKSSQFLHGEVYHDAAIAVMISSPTPQAVSLKHGWTATGKNLVVTKAQGKVVQELDGQPALKVYMDFLKQDIGTFDFEKFYPFASAHPLGVPAGRGEFIVRDPLSASVSDNSITFVSEVPENSIVQIMEGTKESLLEASHVATERARTMLGGQTPALVFVADCVSRLLFFGDQVGEELANIHIGDSSSEQMIGFFSFGEIGVEKAGPPAFHNKTCALYVLPK